MSVNISARSFEGSPRDRCPARKDRREVNDRINVSGFDNSYTYSFLLPQKVQLHLQLLAVSGLENSYAYSFKLHKNVQFVTDNCQRLCHT